MDINDVRLQKSIVWEEAKGKLRALVIADGHKRCVTKFSTLEEDKTAHKEWEDMDKIVEDFISGFEFNGWHE